MLKIISSLPAVGKRALFVYIPLCTISPHRPPIYGYKDIMKVLG